MATTTYPWDEDDPPEQSHRAWDRGYVGARPEYFPPKIGPNHMEVLLAKREPCSVVACHTPTIVCYGGTPLCLAHALEHESRAAGRSSEDLGSW